LTASQKKQIVSVEWTVEVEEIAAHHGLDIEAELASVLSKEICKDAELEFVELEDGRRVFYTDVGKLPPEKVAEYLANIRANFEAIQCQS